MVLELALVRTVELKHMLVKWNPVNPDVNQNGQPFPWEYVHLDDILVDLKLPPETLEVPIPNYFKEWNKSTTKRRNKMVERILETKLDVSEVISRAASHEQLFKCVYITMIFTHEFYVIFYLQTAAVSFPNKDPPARRC